MSINYAYPSSGSVVLDLVLLRHWRQQSSFMLSVEAAVTGRQSPKHGKHSVPSTQAWTHPLMPQPRLALVMNVAVQEQASVRMDAGKGAGNARSAHFRISRLHLPPTSPPLALPSPPRTLSKPPQLIDPHRCPSATVTMLPLRAPFRAIRALPTPMAAALAPRAPARRFYHDKDKPAHAPTQDDAD
ncbi:Uncharacterized protein TPAR_05267 [Tolypocladium paradoxum]|uniref:Uncharacterized protein n=1 Tax=Tolypocladium paradoxum TaxID=94208 RepID=A0A2S4KWE1_9HYPO|nr:Uncharacterized protein TPAR_05267 [Tolypocladium paradoxum]